jgi:hypothetical protein
MISEEKLLKIIEKYQYSKIEEGTFLDIKNEINTNSEIKCNGVSYNDNKLDIDFSNGKKFEVKYKKI